MKLKVYKKEMKYWIKSMSSKVCQLMPLLRYRLCSKKRTVFTSYISMSLLSFKRTSKEIKLNQFLKLKKKSSILVFSLPKSEYLLNGIYRILASTQIIKASIILILTKCKLERNHRTKI